MFSLSLPITPENVDALKAELTKTLAHVKSMHRCEAIARGFGFRSYSSLRAQFAAPHEHVAAGAAFTAYLTAHGFEVPPLAFYRAVTRVAIRGVMAKVPKLSLNGIGIGEPRYLGDNRWESVAELRAKFAKNRADLLTDYTVEPFLASLAFVSLIARTKTVRPNTGSYRLKHIAENFACVWPEGGELGPVYVANGILIAAAVHAGFDIKTYLDDRGWDYPNVNFNMSRASIDDLDCVIRPDGAVAQKRAYEERARAYRTKYRRTRPYAHLVPDILLQQSV